MDAFIAQKIIESLRIGIPPDGFVEILTVGRNHEIQDLLSRLKRKKHGALLIQANYGSGKTHLLRFIRECALNSNYAVSYVTLDAKSAIRFNRMDQILGAICRNIEFPNTNYSKGIRTLFDEIFKSLNNSKKNNRESDFWAKLSNNWKWDYSDILDSPALFVALRAWATNISDKQLIIEDWFYQPWNYYSRRKYLYQQLVESLRKYFHDPRPEWKFYDTSEGIFNFQLQGYNQTWACLRDFNRLVEEIGLNGLILVFDEFEDIIYNINNIQHQESAFWNLFEFYSGKLFPGMTFYAVTPDFVEKCKMILLHKGNYNFDYRRFEGLPKFQMSPLEINDLISLAKKIMDIHMLAYNWNHKHEVIERNLTQLVKKAGSIQLEDKARFTIKEIIKILDDQIDNGN